MLRGDFERKCTNCLISDLVHRQRWTYCRLWYPRRICQRLDGGHPDRSERYLPLRQGRRSPLQGAWHWQLRHHRLHVRPHCQLPSRADQLQRRKGRMYPHGQEVRKEDSPSCYLRFKVIIIANSLTCFVVWQTNGATLPVSTASPPATSTLVCPTLSTRRSRISG